MERRSGRRIQVCIADYDETTYNFLHIGTEWTHGFWQMVNHAIAQRLRHEGFFVRFVTLDLNDYMEWLARESLHDSSTARERFAPSVAGREMGIVPTAPTCEYSALGEHRAESTPNCSQQSKNPNKQH